ncbi:pap2 domain protein [Moniliophthora roreri MCA 2997]|uniref:Pap2 domain protein n=1 Tax=Moniliophthora roreri (strain MCA 2997) TaxID=1381753 RepID=V2XRT5_MONRO|nr:pap2 domain protein [Moniliophthora roreri MCA 2997]
MSTPQGPQASLDLTHVLYDDNSLLSLLLALVTLSPVLLMASYAALAVQTRELLIIVMWAGQFANEGFNYVLKHIIRQDRPNDLVGNGYGFPSSHSQYMGFFSTFLICHLYYRHRFTSTGYPLVDILWRFMIYVGLISWALGVAYSRYHLKYHSPPQILWGLAIGIISGFTLYISLEVIPKRYPKSLFGRFKALLISNPVSTWLQIRDGWAVWPDGGRESEWVRWKREWEKRDQSQNQAKNKWK